MRCENFNFDKAAKLFMLARVPKGQLVDAILQVDYQMYSANGLPDRDRVERELKIMGLAALDYHSHLANCNPHRRAFFEHTLESERISVEEYENLHKGLLKIDKYIRDIIKAKEF